MLVRISFIVFLSLLDHGNSEIEQSCGIALTNSRIVGGYDVMYYKYPWYASLQLEGEPWCGGTLIGHSVIVTAAHCFKDYLKKNISLESVYTVKLGVYNNCNTNEEHQKIYKVKKVYMHELYLKKNPYSDIAVMILDGDTSAYTPACLPEKGLEKREREAYIQGLGDIAFKANMYPCALREARVWIYPDKECEAMLKRQDDSGLSGAFCAGYLEGKIDACQGDSGGPLVVINKDNKYVLLGLTSFGYDCAAKNNLGVYTDISQFLKWIEKTTKIKTTIPDKSSTTAPSTGRPINLTIIPEHFISTKAQKTTESGNENYSGNYVKPTPWSDEIGLPIGASVSGKDHKVVKFPKGIKIEFYYDDSKETEKKKRKNKKNKHRKKPNSNRMFNY